MSSRYAVELAQLDDREFEQLVFALVVAEHPEVDWRRVQLLRAPDGGVDVIFVGELQGRRVGWQAKHVTEPRWTDWEASLDAAVGEPHEVDELTFVFPFNLTKDQPRTFGDRLRARHAHVAVEAWALGHLEDLLRKHPDVYERYFGADSTSQALQRQRLDRLILGGGEIADAADVLKRLKAVGEHLDANDPDFRVEFASGANMAAALVSQIPPPYVSLTFTISGRDTVIAAWARAESPVDRPLFGFTEDDAGQRARAHARAELGSGRPVLLREGIWIGIKSPEILKELSHHGIVLPGFDTGRVQIPAEYEGGLQIEPGEPIELTLVADPEGRALERRFAARPVLAEAPAAGEVVASQDGIFVLLAFVPSGDRLDYTLSLGWRLEEGDVPRLLAAAEWVDAAIETNVALTIGSNTVLEKGPPPPPSEGLRHALTDGLELLRDLTLIEARIGEPIPLPPPAAITEEDFGAIAGAAEALRTGRSTAAFTGGNGKVKAHEITGAADRMSGTSHVRNVDYTIFGKRVVIGRGRYTLPKLKLVDVQALGPGPFSSARVWLEPAAEGRISFELLDHDAA
jgi:hypothetical protein